MTDQLSVSICIPAYNEEKNIAKILHALGNQITKKITINKIIVVSSASTDKTDEIVKEFAKKNSHISLIREKERNGKASAINEFLKTVDDSVIIIESADTVPLGDTIENLCAPFTTDKTIGLTGGAPIPVDDRDTFLGYIVHTWWWFHRHIPRFGEIIAYRNILDKISATTAVDEAYIQAKIIQLGFKCRHVDTAVVHNKGADNIQDLITQRRRVFNGHARLFEKEKVKIDNMTKSSLNLMFFTYPFYNVKEVVWFFAGMCIELFAQFLGLYDLKISRLNPFIWDIAKSTKRVKAKGATV